jgi:hypothetical protein
MYQPTDTLSHTVAVISARFFCQCTPRTIQLVSCIVSARRLSRHEPSRRVRSRRRDRWSAPSEKTLTQRQATSEITRPASIHARARRVSLSSACGRGGAWARSQRQRKETTGNRLAGRGRAQAFAFARDARRPHQPKRCARRISHAQCTRMASGSGSRATELVVSLATRDRTDPWPGRAGSADVILRRERIYLTSDDIIGAGDVAAPKVGLLTCVSLCVCTIAASARCMHAASSNSSWPC